MLLRLLTIAGTGSGAVPNLASYESLSNNISISFPYYNSPSMIAVTPNITETFLIEFAQINVATGNVTGSRSSCIFYTTYLTTNLVYGYFTESENNVTYISISRPIVTNLPLNSKGQMQMHLPMQPQSFYKVDIYVPVGQAGVRLVNKSSSFLRSLLVCTYNMYNRNPVYVPFNLITIKNNKFDIVFMYEVLQSGTLYLGAYLKAKDGKPITSNVWVGFVFGTRSISNTDCVVLSYQGSGKKGEYVSSRQLVEDMKIFGGGWPYDDTSDEINSTNDVLVVSSIVSPKTDDPRSTDSVLPAFYISFMRFFNTNDTVGDTVILTQKNYKICVAYSTSATQSIEEEVQCYFINTIHAALPALLLLFLLPP